MSIELDYVKVCDYSLSDLTTVWASTARCGCGI